MSSRFVPLASGVLTDVGRQRAGGPNQDAAFVLDLPRGGMYAVADGMGGHAAGELASRLALDTVRETYLQRRGVPPHRLIEAVQEANVAVLQSATGEAVGMGTTLLVLVVDDGVGLIAHIGDSRAYLLRGDELTRLTEDHSWVAEQVRLGVLTEKEARNHQWRSVVSNALGGEERARLEIFGLGLKEGDRLLLCSDGLSGVVGEADLQRLLAVRENPQRVTEYLIEAANDAGGPDNITAVVVDIPRTLPMPRYSVPERLSEGPEYADLLLSAHQGSGMLTYVLLTLVYFSLLAAILLPNTLLVVGVSLCVMALTVFGERWLHHRRLEQIQHKPLPFEPR